jgi:cation transport regulator
MRKLWNSAQAPLTTAEPHNSGKRYALEEPLMPYDVNADLPPSVRSHLPEHAQDIFREAFNHAHAEHAHDPRQEEAAFRIAWAAVKRSYEKVGDEWVRKV